jgi:hypothetical protein
MISKKIQKMINDLNDECENEGVTLTLGVLSEEDQVGISQYGNTGSLATLIKEQIKGIVENVSDECDCPACKAAREFREELEETEEVDHEFIINSPEDLVDVLKRIAEGEFK